MRRAPFTRSDVSERSRPSAKATWRAISAWMAGSIMLIDGACGGRSGGRDVTLLPFVMPCMAMRSACAEMWV